MNRVIHAFLGGKQKLFVEANTNMLGKILGAILYSSSENIGGKFSDFDVTICHIKCSSLFFKYKNNLILNL